MWARFLVHGKGLSGCDRRYRQLPSDTLPSTHAELSNQSQPVTLVAANNRKWGFCATFFNRYLQVTEPQRMDQEGTAPVDIATNPRMQPSRNVRVSRPPE